MKRLNAGSGTGEISKRRRKTPSFTPFKQVEIPESWKLESQKLREAVRMSVAHCHYDDSSKRERLGNAVFEALSGQKTMKAAATAHEVPFTTLQTYFHRSRARMAKLMNDNDNAPPEQIQIPVSLTLSPSDMSNALAEEKVAKSKKSKRLNSLLDGLVKKVVENDALVNESLPPSDFTPQKLGSNKRKPKRIYRIIPASTTENDCLEDCELPDWLINQSQNGSAGNIEITTKYGKEEVMAIINSVIPDSSLDENTERSVEGIIGNMLSKSLTIDDMCTFLRLDAAFAQSNAYWTKQLLEFLKLHKKEIDFEKAIGNSDYALHFLSKSQNYECLDKIEKCVNDVCRFSHYPALQQEALRKAVAMVIRGEYSVSGAASVMELPTSAVHPYVHRARAVLETLLPQQAETLGQEISTDKCVMYSNSVSKEVEIVISDLIKTSSHDLNKQQKLRDALCEVLTKDVPVTEISNKYGIEVNAFQPYITKARLLLGQSPYPTSSNNKEISTELGNGLPNLSFDNGKQADEEANFNKILTSIESSLRNIFVGNTFSTTSATVRSKRTKGFSKHEKRCDAENLLKRTNKSTSVSPQTEDSLSSTVIGLNSSSDEFDDANYVQRNTVKIRSRHEKKVENMNAASSEEIEPSTKNNVVLYAESGSDYSDDEFDGLPRSIRGVAKLLSDTKLDKLSVKEYTGTPENLAVKIDKVLRQYRFRGDRKRMRDGILEVLFKSKTLSEACKGNSLAPTTLSTYRKLPVGSTSLADENTKIHPEGVIQNVDVMMLHTQPIISNVECFYKVLITYLIEQQYRRSEEAQQKMRASLEYVLLDGLSVNEALGILKGPSEHVLQVYLSRCREINKCIKTEFPNFKSNVAEAVSKNCANGKQDVGGWVSTVLSNNTNEITKNSIMKSSSKHYKKGNDESSTTQLNLGSLEHLNLIFSEDFRKALYDYLKKLTGVNFPIEDSLIIGLAKMIINKFPMNEQIFFADIVWNQWLADYREEHPEFQE
uniref:HTH psq-type domain-containing protein n=1 Tax=Elaeophora elaphi TaxID=1147741 RepID=A0A0R3RSZ5_9BILA